MDHSVYKSILKQRNLTKPINPIWKMDLSEEEFVQLHDLLQLAYYSNCLDRFGNEAALYYAEWWKRTYSGGVPSKGSVAASIGIPLEAGDDLYYSARESLKKWGVAFLHDNRYHYFRTLLAQGGLPLNHVINNKTNFGTYKQFLRGLVRELTNLNTDYSSDIVPKLDCVGYLPKSFNNSSIYDISVQIAHAIIEGREDLLPYDSQKSDLKDLTNSLRQTVEQTRKDRTRKPLSFLWELMIQNGELKVLYSLNNTTNVSSDTIPGLDPQAVFSFDLFVSKRYIATYKRSAIEEDEYGKKHGIYKRVNSDQQSFLWKGESFIELKLIPNDGDCLFPTALNCYPPNFSSPQVFQEINDMLTQKRGVSSESNVVIAEKKWQSDEPSFPLSLNGESLVYWKFKDTIRLYDEETDEVVSLTNKFTSYSVEFGGMYIDWIESSNYKLLDRVPVIQVYDENSQRIDPNKYQCSYRLKNAYEWKKLTRNTILPHGLIEIKVQFPDEHVCVERFYSIGGLRFNSSQENISSAIVRCNANWAKVVCLKSDGVTSEELEQNEWLLKRVSGEIYPSSIMFALMTEDSPMLKIELPSPFCGIELVNADNIVVKDREVISINQLANYRIVAHGIHNARYRISHVNKEGEEGSVVIGGTIDDGITSLSNLEESIQRIYNLYYENSFNSYAEILVSIMGKTIRLKKYQLDTKAFENKIEVFDHDDIEDSYDLRYEGDLLAIPLDEDFTGNIDAVVLHQDGYNTFMLPEALKEKTFLVFSDKTDKQPVVPAYYHFDGETVDNMNIFEKLSVSRNWQEALMSENYSAGKHWQMAISYFEAASRYNLPFKSFYCLEYIAAHPDLVVKLIISMILFEKKDLFASEVERFEREFAIALHWIRPGIWQQNIAELFDVVGQQLTGVIFSSFNEYFMELMNYTLDSDYAERLRKFYYGQDLPTTQRLTHTEMMSYRSRIVNKDGNASGLPKIPIGLNNTYIIGRHNDMTNSQRTMIFSPIKVAEYLTGIEQKLWEDNSEEGIKLRRVVNFYRTYFTPTYCEILVRVLGYITHNIKA